MKIGKAFVVKFFITTEIIPMCLRIMEKGNELSRILSTFIVLHILLEEIGINYISQDKDRILSILAVFGKMITMQNLSNRLIRHIIRMYSLLSEKEEIRVHMREKLPKVLFNKKLYQMLNESSKKHLKILYRNLNKVTSQESPARGLQQPAHNSSLDNMKLNKSINSSNANSQYDYSSSIKSQVERKDFKYPNVSSYPEDFYNQTNYPQKVFPNGNIKTFQIEPMGINQTTNITNFNQINYTNIYNASPKNFAQPYPNKNYPDYNMMNQLNGSYLKNSDHSKFNLNGLNNNFMTMEGNKYK